MAGRPAGIEVGDREGRSLRLGSRLLVAADGRQSSLARLAGVPGRVRPHNRFFYFAYWRGVERARTQAGPSMRLWLPHPDGASEFPNEDGLTVLVGVYARRRLAEVRADLEGSYMRTLTELPDGPELSNAERVSKILGKIEVPNVIRPAARPGIAFVGDAALAADPTFGVGISFAFMGAEWLVDETSTVLDNRRALDHALRRYRRKFAWRLAPHHLQMADFSTAREMRSLERRAFRCATVDPAFARAFGRVLARERSVFHLLDPRVAGRLLIPRRRLTGGGMNWRERTLLALAVVGFVVPNTMIALFVVRHGLTLDGYFRHWGESLPATQLALDLSIAFVAFALWAAWEGQHLGMRSWWVPIPASLLVGLCFALPLFLLLRERAIRRRPPP